MKTIYVSVFPKEKGDSFKIYALHFGQNPADSQLQQLAKKLFCDPVTETYAVSEAKAVLPKARKADVVWLKDGVYDAEGDMAFYMAAQLKLNNGLERVKYGRGIIGKKLTLDLYNPLVETLKFPLAHAAVESEPQSAPEVPPSEEWKALGFSKAEIEQLELAFGKLKRKPTLAELEMIAQAWSEHTRHKTLRGSFKGPDIKFKNLLGDTVFNATQKLKKRWVLSAFKDNAGIISLNKDWGIAVKLETHNHPSALHPYGGASTGMGGVIRDVLGAGLGAKPIGGIDVFCVSDKEPHVLTGVVEGVADYGNRMGIPTVAGAVVHDDSFTGLPLVFAGCIGLIPRSLAEKPAPEADDWVYVIGAKTGRDGIHGATFSSQGLTGKETASVVQIGNPIMEKKTLDFLMEARDRGLYRSITDLGAGGIACGIWEMADMGKNLGAAVSLDTVPLKESGMQGWEILVSESQERMMIAVPPAKQAELEKLLDIFELDYARMGRFIQGRRMHINHAGATLVNLPLDLLKEVPPRTFKFKENLMPQEPRVAAAKLTPLFQKDSWLQKTGLELLGRPNIASKEKIIRRYDHEVGGRTVGKPMTGKKERSPGDAAVLQPLYDSYKGVALGLGLRVAWAKQNPYWAAWGAVEESLRNIVCVGGGLEYAALLDNYCAGSTSDEKILRELAQVSMALKEASLLYGAPFVSGKDSLNNASEGRQIPTVMLVTATGILKDVRKLISPQLKQKGNLIYALGATKAELGGSEFAELAKLKDNRVPRLDKVLSPKILKAVQSVLDSGCAVSAHDMSEGGFFTAIAEMTFGSGLGVEIDLSKLPADCSHIAELLFSESNSRFILEIPAAKAKAAEALLKGLPFAQIGAVNAQGALKITHGKNKLSWNTKALEEAFYGGD